MMNHSSSTQVARSEVPCINWQSNALRVLRLKQVLQRVGISRAQLYSLMGEGLFPRNFSLCGPGGRAVGWLESDIDDWVASRVERQMNTGRA